MITRIATLGLALTLLTGGCKFLSKEAQKPMKIPYRPETRRCYEGLRRMNVLFQKGFEAMLSVAQTPLPFPTRLRNVMTLHEDILKRAEEQRLPDLEVEGGTFYDCCLFDLLEAMFASEAEAILHGQAEAEEKRRALQALSDLLQGLPFGGPTWREVIKPGIQRTLNEALSQIHPSS